MSCIEPVSVTINCLPLRFNPYVAPRLVISVDVVPIAIPSSMPIAARWVIRVRSDSRDDAIIRRTMKRGVYDGTDTLSEPLGATPALIDALRAVFLTTTVPNSLSSIVGKAGYRTII